MPRIVKILSWLLGTLVCGGLYFIPALLVGVEVGPRLHSYLTVLVVISIWIACDLTAVRRSIIYYQSVVARSLASRKWVYASAFSVFLVVSTTSLEYARTGYCESLTILSVFGLLVSIAGLYLRYTALQSLGEFFSNELRIVSYQQLVTTGVYAKVRHPAYLGQLCILFGICFLTQSLLGFIICLLVAMPTTLLLAVEEDRMLADGFDKFGSYQRNTALLIPGIL